MRCLQTNCEETMAGIKVALQTRALKAAPHKASAVDALKAQLTSLLDQLFPL